MMIILDDFYEVDYIRLFENLPKMDYLSFGLLSLPLVAVLLFGLLLLNGTRKNDTMQRNGSKASQGSNAKGQKNDTADLGVAMNGKSQQQQANKQRKTKAGNNGNKRQENVAATNQQKHSSGFSVDEWLGRGVLFCYDRGSRSSSAGDNSLPRHNPGHRNSASSETGASDDLSSGNSDSCSKATTSKKSRRLRQKRQQQQQQQSQQRAINNTNNNNNNNNNNNKNEKQQRNKSQQNQQQNQINNNSNDDDDAGPNHRADIEEETKENRRKSYNNNSTTSTTITTSNNNTSNDAGNNSGSKLTCQQQQNKSNQNLRKQSTKLATTLRGASGNAGATNSSDKTHQQQQRHFGTGAGGAAGATNKVKNSFSMNSLKNTSGNNKGSALSGSSSSTSLSSSGSSANSSPASSPKNSPTSSPIAFKRANTFFKRQLLQRQFPQSVLDYVVVDEEEFIRYLKRLVIDPNLLRIYGYPVDSTVHEGCVEIFKCLPKHIIQAKAQHLANQANRHNNVINSNDGLYINGYNGQDAESTDSHSGDSGRGSCDSSPASVDSDSSENGEDETNGITAFYTPDGIYQIFSQYDNSLEKQCVRCKNAFMVTSEGEYLTDEACFYHLGKLNPLYEGESIKGWQYNCCQGSEFALGCCSNALHVWTGAAVGLNGPYHDFVRTVRKAPSERTKPKAYALDCEMSFTGRGLEVTKVTMVSHNGHLVYETFVRPKAEIVDYNTRFSGITEEDLSIHSTNVKCLQEVQKDLLELIDADTFLIGHGLDNDLRVLRILHKKVIDTSISFPHTNGFPFRRALRHLMKVYLNRDIQTGDKGHSSFEDSRACLELLMWKLRRELRINFFD